MSRLDVSTVFLQWAAGGLFFLWITTRHRLVGLGYGWLLRVIYAVFALIAVAANGSAPSVGRTVCAALCAVAALATFAVSVIRRSAGVSGGNAEAARRKARVAAMTASVSVANSTPVDSVGNLSAEGTVDGGVVSAEPATAAILMRDQFGRVSAEVERERGDGPEFDPRLDLIAPAIGFVGLVFAGIAAADAVAGVGAQAAAGASAGAVALSVARIVVGALFLGAVSDAMLLGHWYLTQPGLTRRPIIELNDWLLGLWPLEVVLFLIPTGMISVWTGAVDDKWGGMLGWMWGACALTTGILAYVTRIVLRERYYSAVMAATGMLYLAILTAFGTDIVARAVLQ